MAVAVLVGLAGVAGASLALFDPFHTQFDDVEDAKMYVANKLEPAPAKVDKLHIMDWNIKFGGGRIDFFFDCHGDRVNMTKDEVMKNLAGLAKKINQVDPDVLFMQEVDVDSKRAAYVDQLQWLLDHTHLNYGAYASQWRSTWIPKHGLGRVNSGNAVLSKWKISHAERLALPLISDQDPLTQYFYLKRNILRARVDVPGKKGLWVANMHTVAFATDGTKAKQVEDFERELARLDEQGKVFVAGGDMNAIPPGSKMVNDFPDNACKTGDFQADDFSNQIDLLAPLYKRYHAAIPLDEYQGNNAPYLSHTTDKNGFWNRKLDYLFTNASFVKGSGMVHQDVEHGGMKTMPLSDHAPLTVEMAWPGEK